MSSRREWTERSMDQLSVNLGLLGRESPLPLLDGPTTSTSTDHNCYQGQTTSSAAAYHNPELVHQSNRTSIYRASDVGYKVIRCAEVNPSAAGASEQDQIYLRLLHEQKISNFLPLSCHKRVVTDVTYFNNQPALCYKWVSGVTLKEWLDGSEFSNSGNFAASSIGLTVSLRVALSIAKTLSDFHEGGVVYNCLSPENIVLDFDNGKDGGCGGYVATLIDLSCATIYREGSNSRVDLTFEKQMKENDLRGLGLVLNWLFQGRILSDSKECSEADQFDHHCETRQKKRGKSQNVKGREGLPLYLNSLISALLNSNVPSESEDMCYENAKDVYLDLKLLAESSDSSCYMTSKIDDFNTERGGRLKLDEEDMFYGRSVQMSMLMHLFQSSVELGDRPLMATIGGYPGTGKSTLVHQIKKPLLKLNGYFIEGKFDKLAGARPDTVLASALNSFFGRILDDATCTSDNSMTASHNVSMKWRIHDAIGSANNNVLFEILPNFHKWMIATDDGNGITNSSNSSIIAPSPKVKGIGPSHRLKFMFCKLIGAISCRGHPLVLFLDDLQWADDMTLDIIRLVMVDPDIGHFLFLGCYRDNETHSSDPLITTLNAIRDQGVSVLPIKVGPIERECVNTLLSEVLCLPPTLCRQLSTAVHSKTGGIILFILRFLASLNDSGDLWFSIHAQQWMYNLGEIERKEIHGDVVSFTVTHMKNLSRKMQMGLKVSACLGPKFDAQVLEMAMKDDEMDAMFLDSCVECGFLQQCDGSDQYMWGHDTYQQAAYDLIPTSKRESFHLLLGSRLFMTTPKSEMHSSMIFFIVDNMNRGLSLVNDSEQKYDVANLNLLAGERALSTSAFHSAAKYLMTGLSLLDSKSWEVKYDLTLGLHDAASEALFVIGDFARLSKLVDETLIKARSLYHKLNQLNNSVRSLAASSKFEEGIATCLSILCQLGEKFPSEVGDDVIKRELAQVAMLLDGKSHEDLLSLPKMSDDNKLAAMQFMSHIFVMGYITKPRLVLMIYLRMTAMSVNHGICNISPIAFASCGAMFVNDINPDIESAHKMGQVATKMRENLGAVEMIPRLYTIVYGFINIWKEPWQAIIGKHLEAFESGTRIGDIEYAFVNLYLYVNTATFGGCAEDLESCSKNIQLYLKRALQYNQRVIAKGFVILHQLTLDLMGIKQNAYSVLSNDMTEDSCFALIRNNNEKSICRLMCIKRKYVAFFTGDLVLAAEMYELCCQFPLEHVGRLVSVLSSIFIDGMIGFFFARKHGEDETKWSDIGIDAIGSFRKWAKNSEWNFRNKLCLLEAEFCFWRGNKMEAVAKYNESIKAANDHRFVLEEGLAEEKLAVFHLHGGRHDEAVSHLVCARRCYQQWGANALVDRVNKAIETGLLLSSQTKS